VSWRYKVDANGNLTTDDRPGKVVVYVEIGSARFFNFLTQNSDFFDLSSDERAQFKAELPVQRINGEPPCDGAGYWTSDRNYYSTGCALNRQTFQPLT
jgi:Bacterial HORMA domain family 1